MKKDKILDKLEKEIDKVEKEKMKTNDDWIYAYLKGLEVGLHRAYMMIWEAKL